MRKLDRILPEALGRDEVLKTARAQAILRHWPELVGPHLAHRSHPDRYEAGTVWVSVEGSVWAQELRLMSEVILRKLAILAGNQEMFKALRFGVRPLPPPSEAIISVATPSPDFENMTMAEIIARRLKKLGYEADS